MKILCNKKDIQPNNEMMVFVVITKNGEILYQGQQTDDGNEAYRWAKDKNANIRIWDMHGFSHTYELDL